MFPTCHPRRASRKQCSQSVRAASDVAGLLDEAPLEALAPHVPEEDGEARYNLQDAAHDGGDEHREGLRWILDARRGSVRAAGRHWEVAFVLGEAASEKQEDGENYAYAKEPAERQKNARDDGPALGQRVEEIDSLHRDVT